MFDVFDVTHQTYQVLSTATTTISPWWFYKKIKVIGKVTIMIKSLKIYKYNKLRTYH